MASAIEAACMAAAMFWSPNFGCLTPKGVEAFRGYKGQSWTAVCGANGLTWPARKDGSCWMADAPKAPR
jgi:hypothetical protein